MTDATDCFPERAGFSAPVTEALLDWYKRNRRDLPWRRLVDDPYAIWVSEIMLQQTQAATVAPYFERWMARFPNIASLAAAPVEDVLSIWAGLGYYARARNLHRSAQEIAARFGGRVPARESELRSLPGVGRYTAGAVLSIAFNQEAPIVDANVARVLCRVFDVRGDPKSALNQNRLYQLAGSAIPEGRARDFNQALMELGAMICTPSDPACEACPLLPICFAGNSENPTALPEAPAGKRTVRTLHACSVIRKGREVLLVKRPPHGLWGGLWELPRRACLQGENPEQCAARAAAEVAGVRVEIESPVGTVKHSVMHYAITLMGFEARIAGGQPHAVDCVEFRWVAQAEWERLPLAAPQRLMIDLAVRNGSKF